MVIKKGKKIKKVKKSTKKNPQGEKIGAYKHATKRIKIPTEQSEAYMPDKDKEGVSYQQSVRVKGSAPALCWDRGLDAEGFEIQAHPLYIHEKIHPANFIQYLGGGGSRKQENLWDDFNGFPEGSTYEWYKHTGNWQNRIIRGDSSRIMASLIEKEGMRGKVDMVYFDPPYGISFKSNFQVSTRSRGTKASASDIPNEPSMVAGFRDMYQRGIHSYLDNIYKNAHLVRELLADSGSVFLQIGNDNVHRIAVLLDEVFGSENRVATIPFAKTGSSSSQHLPLVTDYILWYAKNKTTLKYKNLYKILSRQEKLGLMNWDAAIEMPNGSSRPLTKEEREDVGALPKGAKIYQRMPLVSMHESTTGRSKDYTWKEKSFKCPLNSHWRVSHKGMDRLAELERLAIAGDDGGRLAWKRYENEIPGWHINNFWSQKMSANDMHYIVETAEPVIERCILMSTDPGDLVLDITCGSGTTAYVAEKWGRRWITTDTAGVAVSLARQRIAAGVFDYYQLKDSQEGAKLEANLTGKAEPKTKAYREDVKGGFVYERVPKVSAAILAYDLEAEPTYLVNAPYKRKGVVRVSSPFTVESESPYRFISPEIMREDGEKERGVFADQVAAIKSALEQSGISGRKLTKDAKLRFTEITEWVPRAGGEWSMGSLKAPPVTHTAWAHVPGEEGKDMKAAIAIAPDDMTAAGAFIDRAAETAARIRGVDLLVVIAFAFEAGPRSSDVEQRGKLKILKAQANRDLQIGNLKDSESDHAFVMVGEPDVKIEDVGDGQITAEVLGYDTYNPGSGNVEPGGAKDIACWMIDSDYDGNSFYARRIHFPIKGDKQIERLKRGLGKNLDKEAWDAMLSHKSTPFKLPKTGRIAVRIVTVTHTEMTAVIDCPAPKKAGRKRRGAE